jgi:protein TonB
VDVAVQINARAPGLDLVRRRIDEVGSRGVPATATVTAPPAAEPVRSAPAVTPPPEPVTTPPPAPPVVAEARTPAPVPAAPTPTPDAVVSANKLTLLRQAEARYPQQAFDTLTSGWVEMEFTVARDGDVKDILVTASEPGRTFDSAAMAALRRYRYAPVVRNGVAVEQRARIRMRFNAQDNQ